MDEVICVNWLLRDLTDAGIVAIASECGHREKPGKAPPGGESGQHWGQWGRIIA